MLVVNLDENIILKEKKKSPNLPQNIKIFDNNFKINLVAGNDRWLFENRPEGAV